MHAFLWGSVLKRILHDWILFFSHDPQRAKHAINDHFHSYAVAKPLTDMARQPIKKTLTLINGQLADINVENRAKRKYPREKSPKPTKVRNLFFYRY